MSEGNSAEEIFPKDQPDQQRHRGEKQESTSQLGCHRYASPDRGFADLVFARASSANIMVIDQ